jgi:hypothetical protein
MSHVEKYSGMHAMSTVKTVNCALKHCSGFETSGTLYQATQCNIAEDVNFQQYCCKNIKSHMLYAVCCLEDAMLRGTAVHKKILTELKFLMLHSLS